MIYNKLTKITVPAKMQKNYKLENADIFIT